MNTTVWGGRDTGFRRGAVVVLARELIGVQAGDGALVPPDRLGPGVVLQLSPDGRVCVHWALAGFDACVEPHDLRPLGPNARLVTIYQCDEQGRRSLLRHKIATLESNWTVELRPKGVVRTLRQDGQVWTFFLNTLTKRVNSPWPYPPDDDHAEAITVADLALEKR